MNVSYRLQTDALGYRKLFGVLGPSTNTIVQPDFDDMRPIGVTNHFSRIFTPNAQAVSNETFIAGAQTIAAHVNSAIDSVLTCNPDYLIMGVSAITFFGGAEGARHFRERIETRTGLQLCIGSESLINAVRAYGSVRKVGLLSPYFPEANARISRFLTDYDLEVVRDTCLKCPSWAAIAQVPSSRLQEELRKLDGDDVDCLIQVGTNLSMVRLAAAAELWLGKPVIAINTATYWNALRSSGIEDRVAGFGRLLEEF